MCYPILGQRELEFSGVKAQFGGGEGREGLVRVLSPSSPLFRGWTQVAYTLNVAHRGLIDPAIRHHTSYHKPADDGL